MVRGERDYTQRVLAITRPMGIISGRMIWEEDFESLITHATQIIGGFAVTTSDGQVWQGDASGQFTIPASSGGIYNARVTVPTPDVVGAEMVFRPNGSNLMRATISFSVYDGAYRHQIAVRLTVETGVLTLQILDSNGAYSIIKTFTGTTITPYWHILYIRLNLGTGLYEIAQVDGSRVPITTQEYRKTADTNAPNAYVQFDFESSLTQDEMVTLDDLVLTYEEI